MDFLPTAAGILLIGSFVGCFGYLWHATGKKPHDE